MDVFIVEKADDLVGLTWERIRVYSNYKSALKHCEQEGMYRIATEEVWD